MAAALVLATALVQPSVSQAAGDSGARSWTMYQLNGAHEAVIDGASAPTSWRLPVNGKVNGGLTYADGSVWFQADRTMYAVDTLSGTPKWTTPLANMAMNSPMLVDGIVTAGTGTSEHLTDYPKKPIVGRQQGDEIDAFDAGSGVKRWNFPTIGEDMPTPVVVSGIRTEIVFVNGDGHVYAIDPTSGRLLWQVPVPGTAWMSSLVTDGQTVFGTTTDGSIDFYNWAIAQKNFDALAYRSWTWAMDPKDGSLLWTAPYGYADCSPTIADGKLFIEQSIPKDSTNGLIENDVIALDSATGKLLWRYSAAPGNVPGHGTAESSIAALYVHNVLYQSLPWRSEFAAFDATTGRILWKIRSHDAIKMSAVEKDGRIFVGDTSGYFYILDEHTGNVLKELKFPQIFTCSPPIIVGDTLYIANDEALYAIKIADLLNGTVPS